MTAKDFVQCRKNDPNLDECLKDAFQRGLPYLGKGNPSLGLMELDSYVIPLIELDQKLDHYDPVNYNLSVELRFPARIIITGDYEGNRKIGSLPVSGNGKFIFDYDIPKMVFNIQMKPVSNKVNKFFEVENLKLTSTVKHVHITMTNLFNGNKDLGDHTDKFINENWRDIINAIQLSIDDAYSILTKHLIQQFLNHVPENQLLIECI
ncbi:Haemolymph juvenile hormone binding [Cinara cedri]|uniref:Haemolymph juvenile hormone binding n=1 Tax=Cinara cedri TaxID=506608 RepID=A0A5E4MP44_9HEMI|nr:Haemolymph juvenile hormone binding [Cinara cedri]